MASERVRRRECTGARPDFADRLGRDLLGALVEARQAKKALVEARVARPGRERARECERLFDPTLSRALETGTWFLSTGLAG